MAKEFAKPFYNSAAWKKCRAAYIAERITIDGGKCEECGETVGEIVHHITKLTPANINDPDISLNHAYLKYVCKDCHDREEDHFNDAAGRKKLSCKFDKNGNPLPL